MTDIATLGIAVDARPVTAADAALDKFAATGKRAEDQANQTSAATDILAAQMAELVSAINRQVSASAAAEQAQREYIQQERASAEAARASAAERKAAADAMRTAKAAEAQAAAEAKQAADALAAAEDRAAKEAADLASAIDRLKASTDPFGFAQDRVNAELMEAERLYKAGAISAAEYARAQQVLAARGTEFAAKQERANQVLMVGAKNARLSATDALNFSRQVADVGVTAAMGMNPLMILIQQGPQIADIMRTSGVGVAGLVRELGLMFGILKVVEPATVAATAATTAHTVANTGLAASATAAAVAEKALEEASEGAAKASGVAAAAAGAQAAGNAAAGASGIAAAAGQTVAVTALGTALGVALIAVSALAVGWGLAGRAIDKSVGDNIDHLNLNEKQLERLKDQNVELGITAGDMWNSLGTTIKEVLVDNFGDQIDDMKKWWTEGLDELGANTMKEIKFIVGIFTGAFGAVKAVWADLPAVIGDAAITAANFAINAVESMVNAGSDGINKLIEGLRFLGNFNPQFAWAKNLPDLGRVSLGRLDNPNAGAMNRAGTAVAEGWAEGRAAGEAGVDAVAERWSENASASRDARVRKEAGKPGEGSKGKTDAEKEYDRQVKASERYLKALQDETAEIGLNAMQTKMANVERAAVEATSKGATAETIALAASIRKAGEEWQAATNKFKTDELRKSLADSNEQIEFENSLIGKNVQERTVANAQREIEIRLRDLEREGYDINAESIQTETNALIANATAKGALALASDNARKAAEDYAQANNRIRDSMEDFGDLFGRQGEALSDIMSVWTDYGQHVLDVQARIAEAENQYGAQSTEAREARARGAQELADAEVNHYGNMLSAAKGFFDEQSVGYKVLRAAEQAYRMYQFAMAVQAMFFDTAETTSAVANAGVRMGVDAAETTSSVAKSGIRAAADGVAAFAKTLASLPFPFNLAAGAVVLAALAGVGVAMSKGGGGGGATGTSAANAAKEEPPSRYTPFASHDTGTPDYLNHSRISPSSPVNSPAAVGMGNRSAVFDFSGANFGNANPEDIKQTIRDTVNEEIVPLVLEDAKTQSREDLKQLSREGLGSGR